MKRFMGTLSLLVAALIAGALMPTTALATYENPIVVSMGDSYASGEGIAPFYGQDSSNKYQDQDWISHRSEESWPGRIVLSVGDTDLMLKLDRAVPSSEGTWGNGFFTDGYHFTYNKWSDGTWFFVAASGAKTENVTSEEQRITVNAKGSLGTYTAALAPQMSVFDYINSVYGEGSVDYVTISIGGNDLGFTNIVSTAATTSQWTDPYALYWQLKHTEDRLEKETIYDIADTYRAIWDAAGSQAYLIVTGYPLLFDGDTQAFLLSQYEMDLINETGLKLDEYLGGLVEYLQDEFNDHLRFVSLIDAFKGHGAYTKDAYINNLIFGAQSEEVGLGFPASSYSIHPNKNGALAYARELQKTIDELEAIRAAEEAARKAAEEEARKAEEERKAAERATGLAAIDEFVARYNEVQRLFEEDDRVSYGTMLEMAQSASEHKQNLQSLMDDILQWLYAQPSCDVAYLSQSQSDWSASLSAELSQVDQAPSGYMTAINSNSVSAEELESRILVLLDYARSIFQ